MMKIRAIIELEVNPEDFVNVQTGKLTSKKTRSWIKWSMLELLSEIYSNITGIQVEEIS